jgi:hypothetical protein
MVTCSGTEKGPPPSALGTRLQTVYVLDLFLQNLGDESMLFHCAEACKRLACDGDGIECAAAPCRCFR